MLKIEVKIEIFPLENVLDVGYLFFTESIQLDGITKNEKYLFGYIINSDAIYNHVQ